MVTEPEETAEADDSRRMDPELKVLGHILRKLDDLDADARARVVAYLASRYKGGS